MPGVIEKRYSLHNYLAQQEQLTRQLQEQVRQLQALANIGLVSAMVAHEMNNILTPLGNYAQLSINNPDDTQLARKALSKTVANSQRAAHILESLLSLANGKPQEKKLHNLRKLTEEVFECIGRDFSKDRIKVVEDIPEGLCVLCEGVCLQQVLMNLFLNARDAMLPAGGQLKISAQKTDDAVIIEVSDTGRGIEPEDLSKVFEPFYTTKTFDSKLKQAGAGLGLAFCCKVIKDHNGTISVRSTPGEETTFRITLPV